MFTSYLLLILLTYNTTGYYIIPPLPTIPIRCKLHMNMNNCNLTPCFKNSCKSTTACETSADNVVCGHAVERASQGKSG